MTTTLIRDGIIFDGTGARPFPGHLVIENAHITDIIHPDQGLPPADIVIDASGCAVSPGFIDMHSHADWLLCLEENPDLLRCLVEQGVTTVVGGNCGFSPAPFREETFFRFRQHTPLLARMPDFTWETMGGFLERLDEVGMCLNIAQLVGHASIRFAASDTMRGAMKAHELQGCLDLLTESLEEGACGVSFGLGYEPGMYSPLEEIEAFCSVAHGKNKPMTVHLKALSVLSPTYPLFTLQPHNLLALKEMIEVSRRTGVRLQLSHFIFVGRHSFWTAERAIQMVEQARRDGIDVLFDAFPYTCGNTTISVMLPHWFLKHTPQAYRNAWMKLRLRAELELGFRLVGFMYKDFQVMDMALEGYDDLNGMRITEIAQRWRMSPFDTLLRLCELSNGSTLMLFHTYSGEPGNESVIEKVLSHELCLFETDAIIKATGYPNPAAMGTFPVICGPLVRTRGLFSLEHAVHHSTGASAERFGISDRGVIRAGKAADIVIFNPETISDTPPVGTKPAGRPTGINHVFINGIHIVKDGVYDSSKRAGQVLKT
ncbi:MAG: N-acyl-D-amino-acid deacylase family protein [Desulfomonilia bacterium]